MQHTSWEKRSTKILSFILISICVIILRVDTVSHIFKYKFLNLIDPDSYYHLRRILYTIQNYPSMLNFDPFLSHPFGEYSPWPPFFDFISASIILISGKSLVVLPFLNLLYFFIAYLIIYYLTNKKTILSIICGIFLAYSGVLRIYTSAGRLDHHAMEMMLITVLSLSFYQYFQNKKFRVLLIFTITLIISFLTWPGAIIYCIPIIIFSLIQNLFKRNNDFPNKGLFVAFHVTAIFLAIYLKYAGYIKIYPYSFKFLSAFQRDFCFIVSIIFFSFHLKQMIEKKIKSESFKKTIYSVCVFSFNFILVIIIFNRFFVELINGLKFIGKDEFILKTAEEASPIFFSNVYSLSLELKRNIFLFTPFFFLSPYIFWKFYVEKKNNFLLIYTFFFFLLTVFQIRFGFFFMLGYSIMFGIYSENFVKKIHPYIILFLFLLLSIGTYYQSSKESYERFTNEEILETMLFLKYKTPYKKDFEKNKNIYGVLASWEIGHHIIQIGNRPSVAHPFIGVAPNNGYKDFIDITFSTDENQVLEIMDKRKARFLILQPVIESIMTDWDEKSKGKNPYIENGKKKQKIFELFTYNLYYFDGITMDKYSSNYKFFRLVFESKKGNVKVYERVLSCKIVLNSKKNSILKAKITDGRRTFFYIDHGIEENNKKIFTIPYSNDKVYPFYATEINIEIEGNKKPISIKDDDIINGKTLYIE